MNDFSLNQATLTFGHPEKKENIVGKRENTGNHHFLLFQQYFLFFLKQKLIFNSLPNYKVLDWSKLKALAKDNEM